MRMYDIIKSKRDGRELTAREIEFFIEGYTRGDIPDYQVSALMMAIFFRKMNKEETANLTMAMARSGDMLDLAPIDGIKVDKHSTGGVGDKTTLVVAPLVAASGVPVAKMSGRGLDHTGGTIDKLEGIPGFNVSMTIQQFISNVNKTGIAISAQTGNLAPADKKLYALRDVTATVDNMSLIASSVMSKKIASGADAIVLDVKSGSGAFMKDDQSAFELAREMVEIGSNVGRRTVAVVTDMSQPLGNAVGNVLEVIEAIDTLRGEGPQDLKELSLALGAQMLLLGRRANSIEEGRNMLEELIKSGKGLEKLKEMVEAQGGDASCIEDTSRLKKANFKLAVISEWEGYVESIAADEIGRAALVLGAGRETKESKIDISVGVLVHKKIGDRIDKGEMLATIHANDMQRAQEARQIIMSAYGISGGIVEKPKLIKGIVASDGISVF
ncbi:pyrimidine-nucleoside phosphorylase Pdp [Peptoclostridium acidaminophilum DSM 3953]|uniref:Pyrimidine-nucleoside phosphorylase n=1 Tax=Peptoclostridium acidaminophilum DSM 3953 TaxID=1286171 RepID=W8T7H8_PEPAC|nr:pyrimidine-nucleoside phosphorylase [Peptoclostridium acidaminophilum]AHM56855.1 pyrimidine-nucleoside phosphorylase Pdp [Peptoclostridium acidaminophilum DSM 3953]